MPQGNHHRGNVVGNIDRYRDSNDYNDDNCDGRASKRSKISISPPTRKNNDKSTSASGSTTTTHEPVGDLRSDNRSAPTTIPATTLNTCCKLCLSKNPDQHTPESFRVYLNRHLIETNLAGSADDTTDGGKPPILRCYESPTPTIYDGWVLETKTEKVAAVILDHMNGLLTLSGVRLYFQRYDNLVTSDRINSPSTLPSSKYSPSSTKRTNGKHQQMLEDAWEYECVVYMAEIPLLMTLPELNSFVNKFMVKAGLFDHDIIVDSKLIGQNHTGVMIHCISPEAAQSMVDELDDVTLKNVKLFLSRHEKVLRKQAQDTRQLLPGAAASNNRSRPSLSSSSSSNNNNNNTLQTPPSTSKSNQTTARNTDVSKLSRFVSLHAGKDICLSKVMVFLEEAIIDPGCGFNSAIVGAVRYTSHHYQLETNTVANASKLLKLSPILYDGTIALVLKGENGRNNSGHPSSTTEDLPTTIGRTSSTLEMAKASDTMKAENGNLTKQVMKLLKENRDLKRINDVLEKAKNSSGSNNKPIELEVSSGEDMDLDDTDSSIEQGEEKTSCQTQGKKEKAKTMKRTSELEKIKQLEKDFAAVTNTCKVLERQMEEAKKEVNDDYERRLHEIHESWREQNTQIKEQKEELERLEEELKSSKDELAQEETEKEQLDFRLQEKSKKYQEMTDALTRSTIVIQEEAAVRKSMALSIVGLRKAKKRAEKELKAHKSLYTKMKSEDNYDF